jgi:glycosyltransferase involved in cell wall biosynthesis
MMRKSPMRPKVCLVFYHGNDWDGVRARQRYLMQALSESVRVVYLDGTWARRGWITVRHPQPGVTVVAGFTSLLAALERRSLGWLARVAGFVFSAIIRQRGESLIFWNAENLKRPHRFIPHERLVFDCIDPSFSEESAEIAAFHRRDSEMLRAADIVFASASSLVERCREENSHVHLLNNACEPAEYSAELLAKSPPPSWWPTDGRPIAAYLGSLDWRFDFALITAVARQSPKLFFILAGNVIPECASLVERLRALPNVICPGRISMEHGRYLIANCSVGLVPFLPGAMNDAVNPVKLYAYALLGKPVVGTPIRELVERPELVLTGQTGEELANHLAGVVDDSSRGPAPEALKAFAQANTWKARAARVVSLFRELGWLGPLEKPPVGAHSLSADHSLASISTAQ